MSETSIESKPEEPIAQGSHDLNTYVAAFLTLHQRRFTGVFETGNRRGWRRLFFLAGDVVGFRSSFAQDSVGRTMVSGGVVPKSRIQWFEERLEPDEPLEAALLAAGVITAEQLAEHDASRIRQGILAPLRAGTGLWSFTPCPGLQPEQVATTLRPRVQGVLELWEGVRQHVPMDTVLPQVSDESLGPLIAGPGLRGMLSMLELKPPLAFLGEAVADGITVEDLFRQIPDRSGNLLKLVWMLERGGLLLREGRAAAPGIPEGLARVWAEAMEPGVETRRRAAARSAWREPEKRPATPIDSGSSHPAIERDAGSAGSSSPAPEERSEPPTAVPEDEPSAAPGHAAAGSHDGGSSSAYVRSVLRAAAAEPLDATQLAAEHAKRMERDFYGFLGLKPGCPRPVVERRCEHMAKRWESVDEATLDEEGRRHRHLLLQGLQIVWQTLAVPERKEEYDRQLREGRVTRVEEIRQALERPESSRSAELPPPQEDPGTEQTGLQQAQRLMARGSWSAAAQILERLRRDSPSSPDVLAELGWASWKATGKATGDDDDPEAFVALALTFEPHHLRALEHYARIAFERADQETLQGRLDRLLAVDKRNAWALEVLASDAVSTAVGRKSTGGGLRFWRRRSDG